MGCFKKVTGRAGVVCSAYIIVFGCLIGAAQPLPCGLELRANDSTISLEQRIAELEQQVAQSGCTELACDSQGCTCCGCRPGWFGSVDYLHWQITRDDLAFAIDDPAGLGVPNSGAAVRSLDYGFSNGIRAAVGTRTDSGWEIGFRYTHFSADDQRSFVPGAGRVLAVQSSPATGLTNADSVSATARLLLNLYDLEAGYWFDLGDSVSLLALAGVRFGEVDQHLRARYNGGAFVNGDISVPTDVDLFGGRLGGAIHYQHSSAVSLFCNTSVTLAASTIQASRREINAGQTVIDVSRRTEPVIPQAELSLGARYSHGPWGIAIAYDWSNWFNLASPLEFADSFNGGVIGATQRDLGLHGFSISASFAY